MSGRTEKTSRLSAGLLKDPIHLLALGFGTGLSPVAPGTFGTLLAVPLGFLLLQLPTGVAVAVVAIAVAAGIFITGESAKRLGIHDHSGIVWDEIAAFLGLVLLIPPGWPWIALGFLAFRAFDILKPWPIRDVDHRLAGGLGIMLDDLVAAVFAAVSVRLIEYLTTLI
jgi:phosphatidylglycerophosphatase A